MPYFAKAETTIVFHKLFSGAGNTNFWCRVELGSVSLERGWTDRGITLIMHRSRAWLVVVSNLNNTQGKSWIISVYEHVALVRGLNCIH